MPLRLFIKIDEPTQNLNDQIKEIDIPDVVPAIAATATAPAMPGAAGLMTALQATKLTAIAPGSLFMTGAGPGGAAKIQTKNNTPTIIASVALTIPGWYLIQFNAAATQDDILAGAIWSYFAVIVGVPLSGSPVVQVPSFPSGNPTFQAGGSSAAWALSGQVVGSTFSILVAGDPTRTVNWGLSSTILSST